MIYSLRSACALSLSLLCLFLISPAYPALYEFEKELFVGTQQGVVHTLLFSPCGRRVAVFEYYDRLAHPYGRGTQAMKDIVLWNLHTGMCEGVLQGHNFPLTALSFSPDGELLVSGDSGGMMILWQVANRRSIEQYISSCAVWAIAFTYSKKYVKRIIFELEGDRNRFFVLGCLSKLQRTFRPGACKKINALAALSTGDTFISASWGHLIRKWDNAGRLLGQYSSRDFYDNDYDVVAALDVCVGDNNALIAGSTTGRLSLLQGGVMGRRQHFFEPVPVSSCAEGDAMIDDGAIGEHWAHKDMISAVQFSCDGKVIISGSHDRTVKIWDRETGTLLQKIAGFSAPICALAVTQDKLWVGCSDGTITLYCDRQKTQEHLQEERELSAMNSAEQAEYKKYREQPVPCVLRDYVGDYDNQDSRGLNNGHVQTSLLSALHERAFGVSHNARLYCKLHEAVAGLSTDGRLNALMRQWIFTPLDVGHRSYIKAIAVHPDGRIFSGSGDSTIKIWDGETGACLQTLKGHRERVGSLAFLADGSLVSGSGDGTIRIWDSITGECIRSMQAHHYQVMASVVVAVLPDDRVVSAADDSIIKIWNTTTGACEKTLAWHDVRSLLVLPNGNIVAGSTHERIGMWDSVTGNLIREFDTKDECNSGDGTVSHLLHMSHGQFASGGRDCSIKIWDYATGVLHEHIGFFGGIFSMAALSGRRLAVAHWSFAEDILIVDIASKTCINKLKGQGSSMYTLAVAPRSTLVSGGYDSRIALWDVSQLTCVQGVPEGGKTVKRVALLSDGSLLALMIGGTMRGWESATRRCKAITSDDQRAICDADTGLSNRYRVTYEMGNGVRDTHACVWDYAATERLHIFPVDSDKNIIRVLPDGRILSSSAQHHCELGIWMRLGDFIKRLPAAEINLIFRFVQDASLTPHGLSPSELALYKRLFYMNDMVKIIRDSDKRAW